jgi:hypothetical protein
MSIICLDLDYYLAFREIFAPSCGKSAHSFIPISGIFSELKFSQVVGQTLKPYERRETGGFSPH